jgi:hypothetical protein
VRRAALLAAVVALGGCGEDGGQGNVGERWAQAIDAEDWEQACALMVPEEDCEAEQRRLYEGLDVGLSKAGGYTSGSSRTDNVTRFAIVSRAGEDERLTSYYELERRAGEQRVDVKIVVER